MSILIFIILLLFGQYGQGQVCAPEGSIELSSPMQVNDVMSRRYIQYCFNGTWTRMCQLFWDEESSKVACRQLGYSDEGALYGLHCDQRLCESVRLTNNCVGTENRLEECGLEKIQCVECNYVWIECQPVCNNGETRLANGSTSRVEVCLDGRWGTICNNGDIRLVNGSTSREGRVEVCSNGRWETICGNQEALAEAVCSQLGLPAQGAEAVNTFDLSSLPTSSCTVQNGSSLNCTPITDTSSGHSMALGVVCRTFEELYNDLQSTGNCTAGETNSNAISNTIIPALGGVVGALVALLFGTATALLITCGALKRSKRKPQERASVWNTTASDERLADPQYVPMTTLANNPAYKLVKHQDQGEQSVYDTVD